MLLIFFFFFHYYSIKYYFCALFPFGKGTLGEKPTLIKQNYILNIKSSYYDFRRKNHARPQRGNESKR
jgi:hypothetical protein